MIRFLTTLLVGSVGGLVGYHLPLPVGPLLGSMLAVGIYNCLGFKAFLPPQVRIGARIIVGSVIGLSLNRDTFMELKTVLVPALIITTSLLMWGIITGYIVYKFCKLDMHTAFLSSSAGGMTELSLLATSLGGDGPKVAILHTIRMITIVSTMPLILLVLEKLLLKGNKSKGEIK